jgi:hypothetical protein
MNKLPPQTVFQHTSLNQKRKIETLKIKVAAGEYRINPQNIAEKLMLKGGFFINAYSSPARSWLFKPGSF